MAVRVGDENIYQPVFTFPLGPSEYPGKSGVAVDHAAVLVAEKNGIRIGFQSDPEALFALFQGPLSLLAFGNIGRYATKFGDIVPIIINRELRGYKCVSFTINRPELFDFQRLSVFEHLLIVAV